MPKFGLIGYPLDHSFSKKYFTEKFEKENKGSHSYHNFAIEEIKLLKEVLNDSELKGLNVTIPYKQEVMPYLDELDETAAAINAVNTIKIENKAGKQFLKGYNTDVIGFRETLRPILKGYQHKALILGTGGASKAVQHVLESIGLEVFFVSRNPQSANTVSYNDLNEVALSTFLVIVNTTPLGTYPNVDECANIPYQFLTNRHLVYDLVYNPSKTTFLRKAEEQGAIIKNGYDMLVGQAEAAWTIWNQ